MDKAVVSVRHGLMYLKCRINFVCIKFIELSMQYCIEKDSHSIELFCNLRFQVKIRVCLAWMNYAIIPVTQLNTVHCSLYLTGIILQMRYSTHPLLHDKEENWYITRGLSS